jgi:uracil phosphoribosyltransferase
MNDAIAVNHPLVQHHLTRLRDKGTPPAEFRELIRRLASLMAYEALEDLDLSDVPVTTPLETVVGKRLAQRIGLVPILRAGLGMVDPILDLLPDAEVWHLGVYRDESTLQPVEYYAKFPSAHPVDVAFVLDPMLATGGSILAALAALDRWGVKCMKVLSILATPEGIAAVRAKHPDVAIRACAVDSHLNAVGYIVPGLGDAGDRTFNTLHPR